jgi:hypothetical protein
LPVLVSSGDSGYGEFLPEPAHNFFTKTQAPNSLKLHRIPCGSNAARGKKRAA